MSSRQYYLTPSTQTVVANETIFLSDIHNDRAFQIFQDLRAKEELCDVYVCSGSQRFPAHRVVLAGTCPLFREKLAAARKESERKQQFDKLEIPEHFDKSIVLNILNFLYEGKLALNANHMMKLLQLLSYLKLEEANIACERFTIDHLRTKNCIEFLQLAETLDLEQLKQKAMEYIQWNFLQVANEEDFVKLTAPQITSLLGSNNLKVRREDRVYEAVWKWYKHDPERRDQDLDVVLKTIRFRQISTKFLKTRVVPELVEGEGKCRSDVEEALTTRRLSQENKDLGTPRNSRKIVYLFNMKTNRFDKFDEEQRACVPCPELASSDSVGKDDNYRCAVIVQDELYVVSKMAVSRFNPVTRKWTWVGEGRSVREAGVCSDKHNIYVFGGKPDDLAAHKFDVRLGLWSTLPEMIRPRRCTGVVVLGRKIYVVGGLNDDGLLDTMECFHIRSQKWKELTGPQEPRFSMGVASWAGSIFVFGGRCDRHSLKSMEAYLPKEDRWVSSPAYLNDSRSEFGHVVYENKIYCFGGRGVNSIECYDYLNEQWRIVGRVSDNTYSVNCLVYPPLN
ncbi:hypothetical protein ACROYT_G034611 [Oculina patagonica]